MRTRVIALAVLLFLSPIALGAEETLHLGGHVDFGRIQEGSSSEFQGMVLQRNAAWLAYGKTASRYDIDLVLGALTWKTGVQDASLRNYQPQVSLGVSEAKFRFGFSDNLHLDFGLMQYKYNPKSRNLGEYLFRSEAYPTLLKTGGYSFVNSSTYQTLGAALAWETLSGTVRHEIAFLSAYDKVPTYDITPAYLITVTPNPGFAMGSGISWHRLFAFKGKATSPRGYDLAYVDKVFVPGNPNEGAVTYTVFGTEKVLDYKWSGTRIDTASLEAYIKVSDPDYKSFPAFGDTIAKVEVRKPETPGGNRENVFLADLEKTDSFARKGQEKAVVYTDPDGSTWEIHPDGYLSMKAVNVMAWFNLDFNALLRISQQRIGTFSLYGEWALLGVENRFIFKNRWQRMPVLLGMEIPTFGLLDGLSMEGEYLANPYLNHLTAYEASRFVPVDYETQDEFHADDLKWSFHAEKKIFPQVSLIMQAASDHMRLPYFQVFNIPADQGRPMVAETRDWYWMTRLQFNL